VTAPATPSPAVIDRPRPPGWIQLAYFAACIGAITDALLTLVLVGQGHGEEAYPPVRALIDAVGLVPGLVATVVVVLAGTTLLAWFATRKAGSATAVLATWALVFFAIARYGAVVSNLVIAVHVGF